MMISHKIVGQGFAEILSKIHRLSLRDNHWSAGEMAALLQGPGTHAVVAMNKDQPIGFLIWRRVADEAEILTICILPAYRTQGAASQLLQIFLDKSIEDGIEQILLEVNETNHTAVNLYIKCGFDAVGRRKDYYGDKNVPKQDALIMKYSQKTTF